MHETNIDRLRKAMANVPDRKVFAINPDMEHKKEQEEIKTESKKKSDEITDFLNEIYTCDDCGTNCRMTGTRLDDKVILKTHKCFDCLIKMETEMRADGTYKEYEFKKMKANAESWLKDFRKQLDEYKDAYQRELQSFVTEKGEVENWGGGMEKREFEKLMDDTYNDLEKKVLGEEKDVEI